MQTDNDDAKRPRVTKTCIGRAATDHEATRMAEPRRPYHHIDHRAVTHRRTDWRQAPVAIIREPWHTHRWCKRLDSFPHRPYFSPLPVIDREWFMECRWPDFLTFSRLRRVRGFMVIGYRFTARRGIERRPLLPRYPARSRPGSLLHSHDQAELGRLQVYMEYGIWTHHSPNRLLRRLIINSIESFWKH